MPTANTTSPKTSKPRAKGARRSATAKASTASRRGTNGTQPNTARTRAVNEQTDALRQVQTATRDTAQVVGDYAERAVLIPVGAALIARDRVVSTVSGTISSYSSPSKTQQQLRRFERRGVTARNRLEREVRKARVRFERELRQRRRVIERSVGDIEDRRDTFAKNGTDLANRVQERILSLV
jgi:hypothetical protein